VPTSSVLASPRMKSTSGTNTSPAPKPVSSSCS
jgi:hypothetical protein